MTVKCHRCDGTRKIECEDDAGWWTVSCDKCEEVRVSEPIENKYVTYFNAVVSNYVEAIVEKDKERHGRAAQAVDNLMREYALATELLDHVRGAGWERIEAALHRGEDFTATAESLAAEYPCIAAEFRDFASDLPAAPPRDTSLL